MKSIMTVCVGNICRSPIAQGMLERQLPSHTVWSAGLEALVGYAADPLSIQVAAAHGIDISAHRAQQVNYFLCQRAELILVMERQHKVRLEQQFPDVRGKTFCLGQYGQFEIADPYQQSLEVFELACSAIAQGVADWVPRILKLG